MRHHFLDQVVTPKTFLQVHEKLQQAYQVKPPILLSQLTHFVYQLVFDNEYIRPEEDLINALEPAFYLYAPLFEERPLGRDRGAICELFPFASPGVDGIEYGFVVHAPELQQEDYPVAEINPRGDPADLHQLGASFKEGITKLFSRALSSATSNPKLWEQFAQPRGTTPEILSRRVQAAIEHLGLFPTKEEPIIFDPFLPPMTPAVPKGWSFSPSADGVGVLAPQLFFGDEEARKEVDVEAECELGPALEFAKRALQKGYPASALLLLREVVFHNFYLDEQVAPCLPLMKQAYLDLNRPLYAKFIEESL